MVIPPLRERKEDILPLVRHFVSQFSLEMNKNEPFIPLEIESIFLSHEWKGNVRELKNAIERAIILYNDVGDGTTLLPEHFNVNPPLLKGEDGGFLDAPLYEVAELATRSAEKARIENALKQTHGNKTRAAEILKVSYKTLLNKIKEYRIG